MHPLFETVANINSEVRMKATAHTWACIGFLPIPHWAVNAEFQTCLKSQMYHECVEQITARLAHTVSAGAFTPDHFGEVRLIYTPLVAFIADLPKQQLIACVAQNSLPVSRATLAQFEHPWPYELQNGDHILTSSIHLVKLPTRGTSSCSRPLVRNLDCSVFTPCSGGTGFLPIQPYSLSRKFCTVATSFSLIISSSGARILLRGTSWISASRICTIALESDIFGVGSPASYR